MKPLCLIAILSLSVLLVSSQGPVAKSKSNQLDANGNKVTPSLIKEFAAKKKKHKKSKRRAYRKVRGSDAGLVRSKKTGATAWVHPKYAHLFQAYIDDLENRDGVAIKYMGGWRRGRCSSGSQHPCGKALDVCQDSRGRTDHLGICHLPPPAEMAAVAKLHGLYEGSRWCDQDYGHAQVDPSGGDCNPKGWTNGVKYVGFLPTLTGMMAKIKEAVAEDKTDTTEVKKTKIAKAEPRRRVHRTLHASRHHRRGRSIRYASRYQQTAYYYPQAYYQRQAYANQFYSGPGGDVQMRSRY